MKKKETSKIRKSGFNPDRACYLTADGKYYCYKFEDIETGQTVTQKLEVGKDLSLELTIMLNETDHDSDLKDRYENELRDPLLKQRSTATRLIRMTRMRSILGTQSLLRVVTRKILCVPNQNRKIR